VEQRAEVEPHELDGRRLVEPEALRVERGEAQHGGERRERNDRLARA
jgi:hypothetical protein